MIMRIIATPLSRRVGRRGAFLLLFGLSWVLYGYFILVAPAQPLQRTVLTQYLPLHAWSALWIVGGGAAIASAFINTRKRPGHDMFGFVGAEVPPLIWGLNYLLSQFIYGVPRGGIIFILFAALSTAVMVVAGWPEPLLERPHGPQ